MNMVNKAAGQGGRQPVQILASIEECQGSGKGQGLHLPPCLALDPNLEGVLRDGLPQFLDGPHAVIEHLVESPKG
jgi:hypothetical protein